jgi:uncharacterized membrane protein
MTKAPPAPDRLIALDLARSAALAGMVAYHLTYDLEAFGWLAPGTAFTGWFWWHARLVAGSFLFLAGVSLWMAHGRGFRPRAFLRRLAVLALAAGAISLATRVALPEAFIFYGILHSIAVASVAGLALLRLPIPAGAALTALTLALPWLWSSPAFDGRALAWTGLFQTMPRTVDFQPFFPWAAALMAGVIAARLAERAGALAALRGLDGPILRRLAWPGRHSLAVYLIHQPILIALVAAGTYFLRAGG